MNRNEESTLDSRRYDPDPRSREIEPGIADGVYVFVQDENGSIFVLPDGATYMSQVLGGARSHNVCRGSDIERGRVQDLCLSGTFQFLTQKDCWPLQVLELKGFRIMPGAVRKLFLMSTPAGQWCYDSVGRCRIV
ncbi:MAG: hypothetical protein R3C20_07330 [Planctomycetaceae bacterium]